jgi:hypothetical protein
LESSSCDSRRRKTRKSEWIVQYQTFRRDTSRANSAAALAPIFGVMRPQIGAGPMRELQDFEVQRAGSIVTVRWRGSPSFTVGVWALASNAEAFEQVAAAMDRGERQRFDPEEMRSCALELRRRARTE